MMFRNAAEAKRMDMSPYFSDAKMLVSMGVKR
jgi:hypothetical protein